MPLLTKYVGERGARRRQEGGRRRVCCAFELTSYFLNGSKQKMAPPLHPSACLAAHIPSLAARPLASTPLPPQSQRKAKVLLSLLRSPLCVWQKSLTDNWRPQWKCNWLAPRVVNNLHSAFNVYTPTHANTHHTHTPTTHTRTCSVVIS